MKEDDVPVIRRQSGGGTVYHDMGNINYTLLSPKDKHNVKENLELICAVINKLGANIYPNCRNDIVTDYDDFTYKISGSAFREKKDRAFHHGTLLINADTSRLYNYLHQPVDDSLDAKGVKSHRSKVINLAKISDNICISDVFKAFLTHFPSCSISFINEHTPLENGETIKEEARHLKSWEWTFGKTLPFKKVYTDGETTITVDVKGGYLDSATDGNTIRDFSTSKMKFRQNKTFEDFIKYFR